MKREKITISKSGIITLPDNPVETVWMRDFEIAELLGVMLPTIKSNIRAIFQLKPEQSLPLQRQKSLRVLHAGTRSSRKRLSEQSPHLRYASGCIA